MGWVMSSSGMVRMGIKVMEPSLPCAAPLSYGGKVGVEVSEVAAAARTLFGSGNLAQCLGIVCDVRQNDQDMHILLEGQVFGSRKGHSGVAIRSTAGSLARFVKITPCLWRRYAGIPE